MFYPAHDSGLRFFSFRLQSCLVYDFILYLIPDTLHMYSKLAILLKRKSYAFSYQPDSNMYLSN